MKSHAVLGLAIIMSAVGWTGCTTSSPTTESGPRGGRVVVVFQQPERFTDVQARATGATEPAILDQLRDYLVTEGSRRVPAGDTLTITFTDIDLAGAYEPWRIRTQDVRLMKSIYPPHDKFTWALTDAAGAVVSQGTENLSDMNYLIRTNIGNDPLFYDKAMLGDWLSRTLH